MTEGIVDRETNGGGNGPSGSEDIAGEQHQGTRTWPFCTFAGPREGVGEGETVFFRLLVKKETDLQ